MTLGNTDHCKCRILFKDDQGMKYVETTVWSIDRERIVRILTDTKGRVGGDDGAAALLGIKRTTLISRMKKLGIDPRALS